MKKRKIDPALLLLLFFSIFSVLLVSALLYSTFKKISSMETEMISPSEYISNSFSSIKETDQYLAGVISRYEAHLHFLEQKNTTDETINTQERAVVYSSPAGPSIFTLEDQSIFSDNTNSTLSSTHIVGIDPGHQDYSIDMSSQEPIGPGASETKAKSTSGTQGSYTSIPEYQLNLDISLLLKDELEKRGYTVVMTRYDNITAISNKERAELVASNNAEIFVRIHANGADSSDSSGALALCPSPDNPYVSSLSSSSEKLSTCILDSYCNATGFKNLGIQYSDNMSGINWSTIPVTILEMGFMSNEHDDTQMNNPSFRPTMVQGIADGIDAYFQN